MSSSTIIAWSSAPAAAATGTPARAIIRISGSQTLALMAHALDSPQTSPGARAARFTLASRQLPCLLVLWRAPRSYTGEDAAELLIPASEPLVRRVLDALLAMPGVRLAGPGEFTARAFAAGKLSLEEAEGVAAAIAATTHDELAAARDLMDGHAGAAYHALAEELATLAALIEAGIDFTDQEDVVAIAPMDLAHRLDGVRASLASRLGERATTEHRAGRALVALVGPPNAGKSTLFNALLGRSRSIASPTAGTTRDAIIEACDLGPCVVDLADSAGLDDLAAASAIDAMARERALTLATRAQVVIWCDPSARFADTRLRDAIAVRAILVQTRADQWLAHDPSPAGEVLPVCALDGWHLSTLKDRIARAARAATNAGSVMVQRHRDALLRVRECVDSARDGIDPGARALPNPELVASHLHAAIDAIGELTGRIERDQVIGRVFARFCVGK